MSTEALGATAGPGEDQAPAEVVTVRFREDDFLGLQRALNDQFRGEWVGVAIYRGTDGDGWVTGKVIAHDINPDIAYEQANEYYKCNPSIVVRLFSTEATPVP